MLIFGKERTLEALKNCAKNGLDRDYIILKMQKMIDNEEATVEELQSIMDIINPPIVVEEPITGE